MLRSGITVELCRVAERGSDDLLNKKRKVKRKLQPVIKKDPRYQEEAEDTPDVIIIDGDDTPEDVPERVEGHSVSGSTTRTSDTLDRPPKRQRLSDPGPTTSKLRCDTTPVRGSSPDIPLVIAATKAR